VLNREALPDSKLFFIFRHALPDGAGDLGSRGGRGLVFISQRVQRAGLSKRHLVGLMVFITTAPRVAQRRLLGVGSYFAHRVPTSPPKIPVKQHPRSYFFGGSPPHFPPHTAHDLPPLVGEHDYNTIVRDPLLPPISTFRARRRFSV